MSVKACFGNVANALVDWDGGRDHCPWRGSSPATPTPWPGGDSLLLLHPPFPPLF
uniref:Uncharacterized protein n=1 Tax=Aegilops tauschii subsp. strangulata TaxID=200361 RepID=A0A453EJA6_AEGTS